MSEHTIVPEELDWTGKDKLIEFLLDWPSILTEEDNEFVNKMETSVTHREGVLKEEMGRLLSLSDRINDYLDHNPGYQDSDPSPPCGTKDWKPQKKGDVHFEQS